MTGTMPDNVRLTLSATDFRTLLLWAEDHRHESPEFELLSRLLTGKLDAMIKHDFYSTYKTAPTPEQREAARQKYLDRQQIPADFRW